MAQEAGAAAAGTDVVTAFATLQDKLYQCESSDEWADDDYVQLTQLLSLADAPKMVQLRSIELAAKYARHFPTLGKEAFGVVMGMKDHGDATVKATVLKHLEGFLKPAAKKTEEGTTLVAELAPEMLEKKFQTADEAAAKMAGEVLQKMIQADVRSVALSVAEQLLSVGEGPFREALLKFFTEDILTGQKKQLAAVQETEVAVKDSITKLLHAVGKTEFIVLLQALAGLKISSDKAVFGPQGIVDTLATLLPECEQMAGLEQWQVERTLGVISSAVPFLTEGVADKRFGAWLIEKCVVPTEAFAAATEEHRVRILQRLCEVLPSLPQEHTDTALVALFPVTLQALPPRPEEGADAPEIDFAIAECLLFAVTVLGKKSAEKFAELAGCKVKATAAEAKEAAAASIKSKEEVDAEKAFKDRIKFIHDKAQEVVLQMNQSRQKLNGVEQSESREALLVELRTVIPLLENISHLCRPLADQYSHFALASVGHLSWRPKPKRSGHKRSAGDSGAPEKRQRHEGGGKGKGKGKGGKGGKGGKNRKGKKH